MRYAVLGAAGQLGRDLCPRLAGEVVALDRARADLTWSARLARALDDVAPDVVVNCAAYNLVDQAEKECEDAFAVNARGVRRLAHWCAERGRLLVHFSTDHVFGQPGQGRPWVEDDEPAPVSVYGLSKLAGEGFVRAAGPRHLIVRTCGLYGLHGSGGKGTNFVETMLRLVRQGGPVRVVDDQTCTPTFTVDLADAVVRLLACGAAGLVHVTSSGSCTWCEFARAIFSLAGARVEVVPITSAALARPAARPTWSVLGSSRLAALGLPPLRPWQEALADYLERRRQAGRDG